MHHQIDTHCQTNNKSQHCEDCTTQEECKTYAAEKRKGQKKKTDISVVSSETVGVWENWKKRKSLPP
jgi:hypothetical protein